MIDTNAASLSNEYETHGYILVQHLIDDELIDRLLYHYQNDIIPSKYPFFRMSTDRYEKNRLNQSGHVLQSFLDIHDYQKYPDFSYIVREIVCHCALQSVLQAITGTAFCNVMQTMLFDANTTTPCHQDWWYIDSVPNGHLVGAWIALEDIQEEAGRFFVIPKSTEVALHIQPNLRHSEWLMRMSVYYNENKQRVVAPPLRKGDVLFWNSRTVHGSLPTIDPRFSRKSITAHFLPDGFAFGNLFVKKDFIKYKQHNGVNFYRNIPDYSIPNLIKRWIKHSVYDSPILMKTLRPLGQFLARKYPSSNLTKN